MVEGAWVVLGAIIGTVGSILTTWLNAHLSKPPADPYDVQATALLKSMLESGPNWRKISTLANVIGAVEKLTKEFLLALGARGSETNGELWGLISRNPLPFPAKPSDTHDPTLAY